MLEYNVSIMVCVCFNADKLMKERTALIICPSSLEISILCFKVRLTFQITYEELYTNRIQGFSASRPGGSNCLVILLNCMTENVKKSIKLMTYEKF